MLESELINFCLFFLLMSPLFDHKLGHKIRRVIRSNFDNVMAKLRSRQNLDFN